MNHDTHTNTHRVKRAIAAFSKMSAILDKVKENFTHRYMPQSLLRANYTASPQSPHLYSAK